MTKVFLNKGVDFLIDYLKRNGVEILTDSKLKPDVLHYFGRGLINFLITVKKIRPRLVITHDFLPRYDCLPKAFRNTLPSLAFDPFLKAIDDLKRKRNVYTTNIDLTSLYYAAIGQEVKLYRLTNTRSPTHKHQNFFSLIKRNLRKFKEFAKIA